MTDQMGDILLEIPDENLPKLASLYQERAPWAPYMVSFVHAAMRWKKFEKYKNCVKFMSPHDCWEEDGTIIVTITCFCQDIFVFTLDDQCVNLYKGLSETERLRYDQRTLFFAIHEKHLHVVKKYIEGNNIPISFAELNYFYTISPEEAKHFSIQCPPDVYINKLEPSAAKQINDVWPHRFTTSERYIAAYIEVNGGYGVFLKSNNKMVAWVLKHIFGHLGMLQTEEEHMRKGYASLVVKVLSKEISEEGYWPVATTLHDNTGAIAMFEKLGFKRNGRCTYIL